MRVRDGYSKVSTRVVIRQNGLDSWTVACCRAHLGLGVFPQFSPVALALGRNDSKLDP